MKYIIGEEIKCGDQVIDKSFNLSINDHNIGIVIVGIEKHQFHPN